MSGLAALGFGSAIGGIVVIGVGTVLLAGAGVYGGYKLAKRKR
jgi:hypothetical protein